MNCAEKMLEHTKVNIEFRFRKSLAQDRFKSNLEFRYQIVVSSIKLRKVFAKFMTPKKIVSEYDQEIPQSQTADNPEAPRGRAAQPCLRSF